MDRTTVLIVGSEVVTLDLLTLQVTPQAPLLAARNAVGVVLEGDAVFAFEGLDAKLNLMTLCEKTSVSPTHWTSLPPMHYTRAYFTPCAFKALIYLAATAATSHSAVESFNSRTEIFTVLPVSLPLDLQLDCPSGN